MSREGVISVSKEWGAVKVDGAAILLSLIKAATFSHKSQRYTYGSASKIFTVCGVVTAVKRFTHRSPRE